MDTVGITFVTIGVVLVVVAIKAIYSANAAAELPLARETFTNWYPLWLHSAISAGSRPTDEHIAEAFANESPRSSRAMMRFHIWPYQSTHVSHTVPPSEYIREKTWLGMNDHRRS